MQNLLNSKPPEIFSIYAIDFNWSVNQLLRSTSEDSYSEAPRPRPSGEGRLEIRHQTFLAAGYL